MLKAIALVVIGLLAGVLGFGVATAAGLNPFQPDSIDQSQPAMLKSIQDLSQYHAAMGDFEVIVDLDDPGDVEWLPGVLGAIANRTGLAARHTLFVAGGTVNAYVDLSGLSEDDLTLSADGNSVTIRLPVAELDEPNLDLDNSRTYLFSQDRGPLAQISDLLEAPDQARFYALAEDKIAAAAEESELRMRATENTRAMLVGMYGSLGINVSFE
ncbi:conserved exported hypothetical protein [Microbacterium sp. C448]|uniref:DUF4230 domain-containing protein n=1 Tax=Microbacterium sp. C448 TaxID=1177594 RepID=UPI0003DE4E7E|nr:DUF4230 domain-containing protein [Microbacterium sp. C448]CDK00261.1 conserved exported hypothetical protein [Microbacterium sp. C448]